VGPTRPHGKKGSHVEDKVGVSERRPHGVEKRCDRLLETTKNEAASLSHPHLEPTSPINRRLISSKHEPRVVTIMHLPSLGFDNVFLVLFKGLW